MTALPSLDAIYAEYEFLDREDRYRLLIDLGKELEPRPDALKTDATKVRGCSAEVWVYPTVTDDGRLHFLDDSNAAIPRPAARPASGPIQRLPAAAAGACVACCAGWACWRCCACKRKS